MSAESGEKQEFTTVRVTREQADALQAYVRRNEDVESAREALDDLGVAELEWDTGQLPVERRFARLENAVEEMYSRVEELEQTIGDLNQKIE